VAFALLAPAIGYEFVNLDDFQYVTQNPDVLAGLSPEGTRWAFTTFRNSNWHPLTWLSLQLDASLWRLKDGKTPDPRGFHLTSVLLHAANAALLFAALRALTGAYWRSAAAALLFAVHPLRVESVAWISERKDVLSTLFGLLALWAYAAYAGRPSVGRYLAVAAAFAGSLLAKPMLVTLPCLLLVLDWWPLGRMGGGGRQVARLAVEKLPLVALAAASCIVTVLAQRSGKAVIGVETFPPGVRLENAAVSYVTYLSKTLWPAGLAVYFPHPALRYADSAGLSHVAAAGAAVVLVVLSAVAVALRRRAPYVLAGWLWYLGALVPVIGLVQVGNQAYADRYTYFPQVGILIALCWGAADLARHRAGVALAAAVAAAAVLAVLTHEQLGVWRDSLALWDHTVRTAGPSPLAMICRGEVLLERRRPDEAADCYREALRLEPTSARAMSNLGLCLLRQGKPEDAGRYFEDACRADPRLPMAHLNLGLVRLEQRRFAEAARAFEAECELDPKQTDAVFYLGQAEFYGGNLPGAVTHLREALRRNPHFGRGHFMLGLALESQGERAEAVRHFEEAVRYDPQFAPARQKLDSFRGR
jgi:Flp pilus assembly protein TadD